MTIGILATRYAKALYAFALEHGEEDMVYNEMRNLSCQLLHLPELQRNICKPILTDEEKENLLAMAAAGDSNVSASSKQFFHFVLKKEEHDHLRYMATAYQSVYRKAKKIVYARYTSAQEADEEILDIIRTLIIKDYGDSVNIELETRVKPELIGGFVLQIEDKQADASIRGELKRMRKMLM